MIVTRDWWGDYHDLVKMGLWECLPYSIKVRIFYNGTPRHRRLHRKLEVP